MKRFEIKMSKKQIAALTAAGIVVGAIVWWKLPVANEWKIDKVTDISKAINAYVVDNFGIKHSIVYAYRDVKSMEKGLTNILNEISSKQIT